MRRFNKTATILFIGILACGCIFFGGCKKAGTGSAVAGGTVQETSSKLDEVRAAVEEAEKNLAELRAERMRLEAELQAKKSAAKQ